MGANRTYPDVKLTEAVWHDEPYDGKPADFFDRDREKRPVLDLLTSPEGSRVVWIVGERRAGKTSLLYLLLSKCRQAGVVAFEVPWQSVHTPADFYKEYLAALDAALGASPSADMLSPGDVCDSTTFWQALEQRRPHTIVKMLVVGVDEIDCILDEMKPESRKEIIGALQRLVREGQKIVITSARKPEKMESAKTSPLIRLGTPIVLTPFLDQDIDNMIDAYLLPCSQEIREAVRNYSGNWPYYAKVILHHLLQISPDEPNRLDLVRREAVNTIAPLCDHLYRHHWNDDERRALLLLARRQTVQAKELALLGPEARAAFASLVERGYLLEEEGQYRFRVRLIELWFCQWIHRELREEEINLAEWLKVLAWQEEAGERTVRVTRDELRRLGF